MAETNEINVQRDWDFEVNLSGLQAPTGKGGNLLPTGYYKVQLTDMYVNPEKNSGRVIIKATVAEGPYMGAIRTDGLGIPKGDDDKVRYYWRGLAESAGYTAAQLDAGQVRLGVNSFKGRTAYMHFVSKEDTDDGYEDVTWLAPMEWSQQKQNFEMSGGTPKKDTSASLGAAGSALGSSEAPKIEEPKSLGGGGSANEGNTTKKSSLLTALGVN
tara:strand:+ start:150 stop:791 length:642 start_codon:yes stop_codon:yes gene_type:complete